VVTASHDHPHHNATEVVLGTPHVIDRPGEFEIGGAIIWGVRTPRTLHEGAKGPVRNVVFVLQMEDLVICHLGDLEQPLNADQLVRIQDCDVLLIPVGGHCTIGPDEASEIVAQIGPKIIIPMHYETPQTLGHLELETAERFCREMGATGVVPQARLQVTASSLPAEPTVVLLEPRA
jgi:L-ascorbate metabolism protein UlaG (beta-lactamase superfamily)